MNPLVDYEIAKSLHQEIVAEYDRYWRYHLDEPANTRRSSSNRIVFGLGSLLVGLFIIVQALV